MVEVIELFSESIANSLCDALGRPVYIGIAFGLMGGAPLCLLALFFLGVAQRYGARFGLLLGFMGAAWGSTCWLVVPYLGGYPNLPGLLIGAAFGVGERGQEITVQITNLLLWPLFGWLLFRLIERASGISRMPSG